MLKASSCLCLNTGDPPLLTHYLQDRLGITIKRKKTQEAVKLPLKVSTDPKWKVGCVLHCWCFPYMKVKHLQFIFIFQHFCVAGARKNPKGVKEATVKGCTMSCTNSAWEKWADCQENTRTWGQEQSRRHLPRKYRALLCYSGICTCPVLGIFI